MKRIIFLALCFLFFVTGVSADSEQHWFFKPTNDARPAMPPEGVPALPESVIMIGPEAEKRVYLTFDAGYVNENVLKITEVLEEEQVPAAFFILKQLVREEVPLLQRWEENGFQVCNHTMTHPNIVHISREKLCEEITGLEEMYREATGKEMAKFFRPPEGAYSLSALKTVEELGYKTVFWSCAYADWDNERQMAENEALALLTRRTHPGAVILLHPTSNTNARILARYIGILKTAGYSFGSLSEL